MFTCYHFVSKSAVTGMLSYFRKNVEGFESLKYFDDYNGIGLTTLHLLEKDLDVKFFNDNDNQLEAFALLCAEYDFDFPKNDMEHKEKYDVVLSFECVEHFQEPKKYVDKILGMLKPNGYLVYSSGFKEVYPGHFSEYTIDGKMYPILTAGREINKYIKTKCDLLHTGWNAKPRIFQKRVK